MRIIHRISDNIDEMKREQLRYFDIEAEIGFFSFDFDESDPLWPELKVLIAEWDCPDFPHTKFTAGECNRAEYLSVVPSWHHQYPMPDGTHEGYLNATYDLSKFCTKCWMGEKQKAPFRMRGEPKWGRKHILQLNWIFDEFFVLPDVWKDVFKPFGIRCRPAVKHRTDEELKTVVQLDVPSIATASLDMGDLPFEICPACCRTKYHPVMRGYHPALTSPQKGPIFKSQEYFGSGGSAFRSVIVSASLFQAIKSHKLKGVQFKPLAEARG